MASQLARRGLLLGALVLLTGASTTVAGGTAVPAGTVGEARAAVADDQAVLTTSAHLTERDRYLVRTVADHRVLTTGQLCALGFASIITARHRLGLLVRIGVLRRFRPRREVGRHRGITFSGRSAPRSSAPRTAMSASGCRRCARTGNSRWNAPSGWAT